MKKKAKKETRKKKESQTKQLINYVKELRGVPSTRHIVVLNDDKLMTHLVTQNACWRPDIYLDNGRYCDGCVLFDNCACRIKRRHKKG